VTEWRWRGAEAGRDSGAVSQDIIDRQTPVHRSSTSSSASPRHRLIYNTASSVAPPRTPVYRQLNCTRGVSKGYKGICTPKIAKNGINNWCRMFL